MINRRYKEIKYKRVIDLNAKFVLIGNRIDGYVNFSLETFENFEDLKTKLPYTLTSIEGKGEWDARLYQITKPLKLKWQHGYYRVPYQGKLLLNYSYMNDPIRSVMFKKDYIEIIGYDAFKTWDRDEHNNTIVKQSIYMEKIVIKIV
jgi:hypothetical protein